MGLRSGPGPKPVEVTNPTQALSTQIAFWFGSVRSCHTNDFLPGKRITDFRIKGGKVTSVSVGVVID